MHLPRLSIAAAVLAAAGVVGAAPAASGFACGEGGKPDPSTKRCDCPLGKVEQTDPKAGSRCVPAPPPKSAAEAYARIDALLAARWDDDSGPTPKLHYDGSADVVVKRLDADDKQRAALVASLEAIDATFHEPTQLPITLARMASVHDAQRAALARASVRVLDACTDKKIADIEQKAQWVLADPWASDEAQYHAQALLEKAAAIRASVQTSWLDRRQGYYDVLEPAMIDGYARAHLLAKAAGLSHPRIDKARQRLAFYTDVLGDAAMKRHLHRCEQAFPSFKYVNQMFKAKP